MKNLNIIIILLSLSVVTKAQQSGVFKYQYLPNHTYNVTATTAIETEVMLTKVGINDSTSQAGPKKNIQWTINTEAAGAIKTAVENASKRLPFTMSCSKSLIKTGINGTDVSPSVYDPTQGSIINGIIDADTKIHPDTTTATTAVKTAIGSMIGGMPLKIAFPAKRMKIGDTFTEEEPLTLLDVPGLNLKKDYTMKVTYKLTAIKGNLAYFDTISEFDMDINTQAANGHKVTGKGKGSGAGKMIFNIAKYFPESVTNNKTYTLGLESVLTKIDAKFKMSEDKQYDVATN